MSTVETVQRELLDRMLRGEFEPGHRLRQDALASELGVSKIPVREALHRLAATGLLAFETNRGAVVPELNAAEAIENFTLRRSIEPRLLEEAMPHITVVDLAEAELALDSANLSVAEANWVFHRSLYQASGWKRGLAITEMLHAAVAPYVELYVETLEGGDDSNEQHLMMLDACRKADIKAALDLLEQHLTEAQAALAGFFTK